jgi:hypothetical protein
MAAALWIAEVAARQVDDGDRKLMPAWSKEIFDAMRAEIKAKLEKSAAEGCTDANLLVTDMVYIVSKWSVRSARAYAWRIASEVHEEGKRRHAEMLQAVEGMAKRLDALEYKYQREILIRLSEPPR